MAETHRPWVVSRRRVLIAASVGLPVIAGGLTWRWWATAADTNAAPQVSSGDRRRETRPTLDPKLFTGKVALAHQAAREIPDVLDELHCYCGCDRTAGHVSLLSCYTDRHAVT